MCQHGKEDSQTLHECTSHPWPGGLAAPLSTRAWRTQPRSLPPGPSHGIRPKAAQLLPLISLGDIDPCLPLSSSWMGDVLMGKKTGRSQRISVTAITFHSGSYFASSLEAHKLNLEGGAPRNPQREVHKTRTGCPGPIKVKHCHQVADLGHHRLPAPSRTPASARDKKHDRAGGHALPFFFLKLFYLY